MQGAVGSGVIWCDIIPYIDLQKTMHTLIHDLVVITLDQKIGIRCEIELWVFYREGKLMSSMRESRT